MQGNGMGGESYGLITERYAMHGYIAKVAQPGKIL